MRKPDNPYSNMPASAFWRTGVAEPGLFNFQDLWTSKWHLPSDARFSTYGSCFAQHISRTLIARNLNWVDAEPAPGRTPPELARQYNYGVYSSRTGNIYTEAQLNAWMDMAMDPEAAARIELWEGDGGVRDSLRPLIEPRGFASVAEARASLRASAIAFGNSITSADVFVFTLGLTEGWVNKTSGQPYALCPGTVAGTFDPELHMFANYSYPQIRQGLENAFTRMWELNPDLRILLTVSPVPLTATADDTHVLVSTTYSKATLRAVAGDLARTSDQIDYFPSYEIISAPPSRGIFFEQDMRSVAPAGVKFVMDHFFTGLDISGAAKRNDPAPGLAKREAEERRMADEELVCEEMMLDLRNEA